MAISLIRSGSAMNFAATSTSPALGGTAATGNLLVATFGGTSTSVNTPAGWTKIAENILSPTVCAIFVKESDGTETGVTITWPASASAGAAVYEFSGATITERVVEATGAAGGSSNTTAALGPTASGPLAGDLAIMAVGLNSQASAAVAPSAGWTAGPRTGDTDRRVGAWREVASDGTVSGTLNWSGAASYAGALVVLEASAGGPSGVSTVEVRIDGGAWVAATDTSGNASWSTWDYDLDLDTLSLADSHTFEARATDGAANVSTIASETFYHSPSGMWGATAGGSGHLIPVEAHGWDLAGGPSPMGIVLSNGSNLMLSNGTILERT